MTTGEVAKEAKADPVLMARILRNLAAFGHIDEVGADKFQANKFSRAFTTTKGISLAKFS